MRILMVTPYPPARDGLANYAVQEVKRLRAEGHDVEVLSPGPSAAHHHLDLRGPRGALALGKRLRAYDRVIVQYHPAPFFDGVVTPRNRAATSAATSLVRSTRRGTARVGITPVAIRRADSARMDVHTARATASGRKDVIAATVKGAADRVRSSAVDSCAARVPAAPAAGVVRVAASPLAASRA